MKASLNMVILLGNLGQDPEMKTTQGGHSLVNISLATNKGRKDQAGNWQDELIWHRVTCWDRIAEIACQYCHKGSQVMIEGYLQPNEWTDQDGKKRYGVSIVASKLLLLGSPERKKRRPVIDKNDNLAVQGDDNGQLPF
jgi:single-strand DNA-binding protein